MKERERSTVKPALREKGAPRETNQDAPSVTLTTRRGARSRKHLWLKPRNEIILYWNNYRQYEAVLGV